MQVILISEIFILHIKFVSSSLNQRHVQWWPKLLEHLTDLKILTFFACSWNMQMVALSTTNIRWSESYCFYSLLTLIFGMSIFCSNYSSTSLWHSVNIFPDNTNVIPCLLQLKPKAFIWVYNRSVQFIFQLAPNLLEGLRTGLWGGQSIICPWTIVLSKNFKY